MKFAHESEGNHDLQHQTWKDLIDVLNSGYDADFGRDHIFLLQDLYKQIFKRVKKSPFDKVDAGNAEPLKEIFAFELERLNEHYQSRFENIMSNAEIKARIADYLSEQVYHQLRVNKCDLQLQPKKRKME